MTVFVADERNGVTGRADPAPLTHEAQRTEAGNSAAPSDLASGSAAQSSQATRVPVDLERLRGLAEFVVADRRVPADMALSVLCVSTSAMAELNRVHMGGDGPTDVLAFPIDMPGETMPGAPAVLGDVVLCPEVAAAQAADAGHDVSAELEMLVVHGILHLLGHDHAEESEQREMTELTERLLADWRARSGSPS